MAVVRWCERCKPSRDERTDRVLVTSPRGYQHLMWVADYMTLCGQDAYTWSRVIDADSIALGATPTSDDPGRTAGATRERGGAA